MGGPEPRYVLAVMGFAILCGVGICAVDAHAAAAESTGGTSGPAGEPFNNYVMPGPNGSTAPNGSTPPSSSTASSSSTATNSAAPNSSASVATIGSLRLTTGVSVGESYDDNVNLAPTNGSPRSDFITSVSPNLSAFGQGSRVTFGLTYDPQLLYYAEGNRGTTVDQNLLGVGHAEIYPQTLFLDANAAISQYYVGNTGPVGASTLSSNSNLQTVQTYSASPYLRHHFGPYADSETRYAFGYSTTGANTIAPVETDEARQTVTSGDYFGRLGWRLTGDALWYNTLEASQDPLSNTTATDKYGRADLSYLIYEGLSALGGVGYEAIHSPTLLSQPKGVIWDAGFRYQPAPYAWLSFTYGRRYGESDYEFSSEYDIGPRLKAFATYTQTFQTGLSFLAANVGQTTLSPSGQFVNGLTGQPVTSNPLAYSGSTAFGLSNQSYIDKRFQAIIVATRGRNTYTLTGYQERQSGSAASVNIAFTNTRSVGGTAGWTRQLWPRLASNLSAQYYNITYQDGSGRKDNVYFINAGLIYTLSPSLTGQLTFARSSDLSNVPADSVDDDVVSVFLQKQF